MSNDQSYSIGHAARICNISVQTLRYYNKIGLVIPNQTDKLTGYRYYANQDLLRIMIVQDMKLLQFSLEEIGTLLKSGNLESLQITLEAKHKEMSEELKRLEQTVKSIEQRTARIILLQELGKGLVDIDVLVEMKQLPERHVLSDRGYYACGMEPSIVKFTELFHKIEASGLTPGGIMTVYHENIMDFDRAKSDLEYCVILESIGLETAPIRTLPQGDYITARYCGIPNDISCKKIYSKLQEWIETHGYIESGDPIEYYIVDRAQMLKPDEFIVELQVPVRKVLTL